VNDVARADREAVGRARRCEVYRHRARADGVARGSRAREGCNVPRPATAAATPTAANVPSSFFTVLFSMIRPPGPMGGFATQMSLAKVGAEVPVGMKPVWGYAGSVAVSVYLLKDPIIWQVGDLFL
jgi:hypothetical protein